jgi:hypothetical protein
VQGNFCISFVGKVLIGRKVEVWKKDIVINAFLLKIWFRKIKTMSVGKKHGKRRKLRREYK